MEREYPTVEEPGTIEDFERLAGECWGSDPCPCRAADEWVMEHSAADEWGCPGWCIVLSQAGDGPVQGPPAPEPEGFGGIPF